MIVGTVSLYGLEGSLAFPASVSVVSFGPLGVADQCPKETDNHTHISLAFSHNDTDVDADVDKHFTDFTE